MNTFLNQYLAVVLAQRLEESARMSRGEHHSPSRQRRRDRQERGRSTTR